jgi:hypothetical protein
MMREVNRSHEADVAAKSWGKGKVGAGAVADRRQQALRGSSISLRKQRYASRIGSPYCHTPLSPMVLLVMEGAPSANGMT